MENEEKKREVVKYFETHTERETLKKFGMDAGSYRSIYRWKNKFKDKTVTLEDAKKLKPHQDKILFGSVSTPFEFVGMYRDTHLIIYDEPPSKHEDMVLISSCKSVH